MKDSFRPVSRKNDIVVQELKDETLIYDLKSNKAYCLNETSALVWQLCDGKRTVSEMSDEMSKRLKSLVSEDFVMIALDQFDKDELLERNGEKGDHFRGLSRREVVRRVGFATIVALPMISSIVAPSASMAQSTLIPFGGFPCPSGPTALCVTGFCVGGVCCNPGATGTAPPGTVVLCVPNTATTCTGAPGSTNCCSGSSTLGVEGICGSGQLECRCDPAP